MKKQDKIVEACCEKCTRADWALEAETWAEFLDRVKTLPPGDREDNRIAKRIHLIVDRFAPPA